MRNNEHFSNLPFFKLTSSSVEAQSNDSSSSNEDGYVNTLIVSNLTGLLPPASSDVRRADPKRRKANGE